MSLTVTRFVPTPLPSSAARPLTPNDLRTLLEWAGERLMAMPHTGPRLNSIRVIWPEYSQDRFEVLDHRGFVPLRAAVPPAAEITLMEKILLLPNVCERKISRRVLHLRALVYPISSKYVYSWHKLGKVIGSDSRTVQGIHLRALSEVLEKAGRDALALGDELECV